MLTFIFGIWASEPPPGPGERLKRPGLIGLNGGVAAHTVLTELDDQKLFSCGMALIKNTASYIHETFFISLKVL